MPKITTKDSETGDSSAVVKTTTSATTTTTTQEGSSKKIVTRAATLTELWKKAPSTSTNAGTSGTKRKSIKQTEVTTSTPSGSAASSSKSVSDKVTAAIIQSTLDTLENDTMEESWRTVLAEEFSKAYFKELKSFLLKEMCSHTVYPSVENIYSWSRFTPLDQVKVVILGQDPYHDVGQAHGLSFSVLPPTKPPPSLKNIYKQLETDIPGFKTPKTGDLSPVAKQGVLWLNTSLTVQAHKAASHARKGWETFTAQAIRAVLKREGSSQPGVVLMAWGLPAQKTFTSIGVDEKKHLLLKSAHPSPLSAHRGFLGNGHFKKANEWLTEKYGKEAAIDWSVLSA